MANQNPRLTSTLLERLRDVFNSLPQLETVIITHSAALNRLPYPKSVRHMKLHYRHKYSEDWQSVASRESLEHKGVSFVDTNTKSRGSNPVDEHGDCTNITVFVQEKEDNSCNLNVSRVDGKAVANIRTVIVLANVMSNLPKVLEKLDLSITVSKTNSTCFSVDGEKAQITKVSEEETSLALAKVVGNLPKYLREKVVYTVFSLITSFIDISLPPNRNKFKNSISCFGIWRTCHNYLFKSFVWA